MEEELLPPPPKKAQQTEDLLPPPPKKTAGVSAITPEQPQEERSFLGALPLIGDAIHYGGKAVERGFYAGQTADVINPYAKEGEITPEAIQDVARYQQEIQKRGEPSFVKEGILMSLAKRPLSTLTELMVESLASTAVHGASRIAGGAAIGAGIGATGLGVGAVPGAATGAMAAGVEAGGNVEYSAKILQSLNEMGVDTTNPDQIVEAFTDPTKTEELRKRALQKAIPIMAFDALSAGMAGKFMSGAIAKGTSKLAAGAKEMGTQMATGAAGEFAGQKVSGEQTDTEAILAEAIGEIGGGTVESITGTVANTPKQTVANKIETEAAAVPVDVPIAQQQDAIFEEELSDLSTFEEELGQPKPVTDAVQEQGPASVPVGEQTDVVPQMEEGIPQAEPQEPTQEGQVVAKNTPRKPTNFIERRDEFENLGPGHANFSKHLNWLVGDGTLTNERADLLRSIFTNTNDEWLGRVAPKSEILTENSGFAYDKGLEKGKLPKRAVLSLKRGLAYLNDSNSKEWSSPGMEPTVVFLHEYAHLADKTFLTESDSAFVQQVFDRLKSEGKLVAHFKQGNLTESEAQYVAQNPQEFLAQAFAEYVITNKVSNPELKPIILKIYEKFVDAINNLINRPALDESVKLNKIYERMLAGEFKQKLGTIKAATETTQQTTEQVTPEQQEFDTAMAAYMKDQSDQNSNRVKAAQQALQAPAKPSNATVPFQQQINELAKLEPGQELTDKARMIIEQSAFPEDTKRELQGLLNVPNMNLNDKNRLVEGLKKAAGINTTTIKESTLRDRLRDAWRSGITLGVKDAETRVKSAIESVRTIISESETSLPARVYKSILSRLNGLNTKNQDKVNALFDYVSRVTESRKVAEQIEAIEDLQERIKSKKNLLPENQQRLIDALAKVNPTDITDLDEFVQLLNDISANMISPGKPGRGEPVAFDRLNEIARKVNAEYVIAENKRRIDKLQEQDNQFTDEEGLISKEDIERGTLSAEIKGLIPSLDKGVGKIKSKQVESLKKLTQAHLDRLSLDELKQLIKGIEQIVKNGDHSLIAGVMPLIDVIQNTHRLDNLKNLAPGSKSAIGKTVAPQRFANLSQVFDYLYNSLSASAAKLAQWSGVRGIVNGAARARSREHEYRVKIDDLRKQLEKGKKIDLMSPENMVRLEVYGEFASQMQDTADATMIENALHNWRTSSEYYKKTGDPDNIEVAKIIDQMIKLFDGAKDADQVRSRMQSAYPDVKAFKDGISNILEELAPEAREAAETLLGKQPLFYKPGTYWPLSVQYTANKPIDSKQYPLGIKLSLPENLIERVAKLKEGTARKIEGVNGVMQSIASSLDAIEVGESRNTANAFLKVDAREDNKYLGAAQTNIALGSLLRESFSEQPGGGFYDRFLNTIRRSAAATVLTGIKSAVSQYIPTMTRTAIDFALKRGAQGKAPNLIMNGANTPSAKRLRSNFAISKRGERSLGTYVGDITKIEKSYRGVNKYADLVGTAFDNALRAVGQFIPKYTFNFADTSAAERAWTVAYLDYLDSKGVDISKQSTDEFWANENKLKDEPVRQEAAAAAEQYVSVNQMESGSLETPVVYKKHQLLNAIIPFTKYLTGKATVMNNRAKTLVGGLTNGAFGTPKSTSEETKTAARQLAADYTELVIFHAGVKHLLIYPIQDALVNSYLESMDLEPEDEEKLAKRYRSRKGYSLMEMVTSGGVPLVPLVILSQMVPDSWKAKAWNGMIERMAKEPDQPSSEFREETELPIVPEPRDSQQLLGILGVLESQTSMGQDWRYERIDGTPYIIYKDMKGDTINKAISEEEADALDDGLLISMLSMFGAKDISDVMKQAERIVARRTKTSKQSTVLP